MPILSLSNNKLKLYCSLHLRKNRDKLQLFIIEGKKFVKDICDNYPERVEAIISFDEQLLFDQFGSHASYCVDPSAFKKLSQHQEPSGVLAIIKMSHQLEGNEELGPLTLVLDRIQDPGNLGTIIRTADWFGIRKILLVAGTVDPYNPKVVQASAAAVLNMRWARLSVQEIGEALANHTCLLLDMNGEDLAKQSVVAKNQPIALIVGNEGSGLSNWHQLSKSKKVCISPSQSSIPISDSLNASVSVAIALYQLTKSVL